MKHSYKKRLFSAEKTADEMKDKRERERDTYSNRRFDFDLFKIKIFSFLFFALRRIFEVYLSIS